MDRPDLSRTRWLETSDGNLYVWDKNSRLFRVSENSFEEVTDLGVAVRMAFKSAEISSERAKEMAPWVFEGLKAE